MLMSSNVLMNYLILVLQPIATFKFPLGEVSLQEKEEEEEDQKRVLSVNGILKSHILNGVLTANYNEENLGLRYAFKVVFFSSFIAPTLSRKFYSPVS